MRTFADRPDFEAALKELPAPSKAVTDILYMDAYFKPFFSETGIIGDVKVQEIAAYVEDTLRTSLSSAQVAGIQEAVARPEGQARDWYNALIYAFDANGRIADVFLTISQPDPCTRIPMPYRFEATFPMGDYAAQSRDAVTKLWPMIRSIEFAIPKIPGGAKYREKFQHGAIVLINGDMAVATGNAALTEAGLHLPDVNHDAIAGLYC
jgi:hypothetical protein